MRSGAACGFTVIALCLGLTACGDSVQGPSAGDPAQPPGSGAASFERYTFTNEAGTRTYKVFVPASYTGQALPLIVELHGCGGNADEEARWSRFNPLAEQRGLIVVYPEQDANANGSRCWNWFLAEHQARDAGEPAILAGITREVASRWGTDPRRTYVGGISAGGAMSNILAVTYPDVFAAAMIYAGCQYKGGPSCLGAQGTLTDEQAGQIAHETMGANARVVPVMVIVGELYRDAGGCILAQRWLINGMAHAWSNGESNGSPRDQLFTDPLGPDVTTPTVDFFLSHPMPAASVRCEQVSS